MIVFITIDINTVIIIIANNTNDITLVYGITIRIISTPFPSHVTPTSNNNNNSAPLLDPGHAGPREQKASSRAIQLPL